MNAFHPIAAKSAGPAFSVVATADFAKNVNVAISAALLRSAWARYFGASTVNPVFISIPGPDASGGIPSAKGVEP